MLGSRPAFLAAEYIYMCAWDEISHQILSTLIFFHLIFFRTQGDCQQVYKNAGGCM